MGSKKLIKSVPFLLVISFIVLWTLFLIYFGADHLIEVIGVKNGYLFAFLIAAFGGVSSLTMTSLYTTMYKFLDAGMMDPVLLGLIVGCGITIGDSLFYYLGVTGRKLFTGKAKQWSDWLVEMINRQKGWQVQTLILIYTGFTPLPNDILSVSLAVARFRYRKVFIPLLIGNIIQMILIGIGVVYGIDYLQEILA